MTRTTINIYTWQKQRSQKIGKQHGKPLGAQNLIAKKQKRTHLKLDIPAPNWKKPRIPTAYILMKNKDIEKHRPITSYFKHPCKTILRAANSALMFIMNILREKHRSHFTFNIGKPENLKRLIQEINLRKIHLDKIYKKGNTLRIFLGDIKQMYTELEHSEIREALLWLILKFKKQFGKHMTLKIRRKLCKYSPEKSTNVLLGNNAVSKKMLLYNDNDPTTGNYFF